MKYKNYRKQTKFKKIITGVVIKNKGIIFAASNSKGPEDFQELKMAVEMMAR